MCLLWDGYHNQANPSFHIITVTVTTTTTIIVIIIWYWELSSHLPLARQTLVAELYHHYFGVTRTGEVNSLQEFGLHSAA